MPTHFTGFSAFSYIIIYYNPNVGRKGTKKNAYVQEKKLFFIAIGCIFTKFLIHNSLKLPRTSLTIRLPLATSRHFLPARFSANHLRAGITVYGRKAKGVGCMVYGVGRKVK